MVIIYINYLHALMCKPCEKIQELPRKATDDIIWESAKVHAAVLLSQPKKSPPKRSFLRKLCCMSTHEVAISICEEEDESRDTREHQQLVETCPLMNGRPRSRSIQSIQEQSTNRCRKQSVCERTEVDRELVYNTLQSYKQASYIDNFLVNL